MRPVTFLPASKPCGSSEAPLLRSLGALAVDHRRRWARLAPFPVAYRHIERVVDALERAVPVPQHEVVMCRRLRRQVLGQRRPLAARPKNIEDPVEHLADVHVARPTAAPAGSLARSAPTPHPSDRSGNASRAVQRLAGVQASTSRTPPECFGCPTMNHKRLIRFNNFLDRLLERSRGLSAPPHLRVQDSRPETSTRPRPRIGSGCGVQHLGWSMQAQNRASTA